MYFGILVSHVRSAEERGTPHGDVKSPDSDRPHRFAALWRAMRVLFS